MQDADELRTEAVETGASETPAPESAVQSGDAPSAETSQAQPSATPASVAQPAAAPPAAAQPAAPSLEAFLRVRDEAKEAKRQAALYRQRLEEQAKREREAAAQAPNPLDDPEGFVRWQQQQIMSARRELATQFEERERQRVETLSREMMEDQLGPEKFAELEKFINAAPDEAHRVALQQAHPYRWFYRKFQEMQKAQRANATLEKLGDKDFDAYVEELVKQRLEAAQSAQPEPDNRSAQPRRPDGTFASPSTQPQRRQSAPSLAAVAGAPAPNGAAHSGYDALFRK